MDCNSNQKLGHTNGWNGGKFWKGPAISNRFQPLRAVEAYVYVCRTAKRTLMFDITENNKVTCFWN